MSLIVVSGALANKPGNGGNAWAVMSWMLGLKRLGHDVYFLEQIAPAVSVDTTGAPCDRDRSVNLAYFRHVTGCFGVATRSALVSEGGTRSDGLSWDEVLHVAEAADLLVNISGHLSLDALKPMFRTRAFIDLDPGYTQFWHAAGLAEHKLRDHHYYFTVGENIGTPGCEIPTGEIAWRPIRQPVVLDDWPVTTIEDHARFTTVSSWRGPFGRLTHNGREFGLKAHEFRKFVTLPTLAAGRFEIALDVHPADRPDVELLRNHAWTIVDPTSVAADPVAFRNYIQASDAEFSVAQGIYVDTHSGWFSDRTVRYLASGKPALIQDTGFGRTYPVGAGLIPFRTLDEAVAGAADVARNYQHHCRAARAIAEEYFDSDRVLGRFLDALNKS